MGVKYKDLGLKVKSDVSIVKIGDYEVSVKQYLETDKKAAIIRNAIVGSMINGYVEEILCEAYIHIMIIENYTDIDFGEEGFEDVIQVYDELSSSEILDQIISAIDPSEYNFIMDSANKLIQSANEYAKSNAAAMELQASILESLSNKDSN